MKRARRYLGLFLAGLVSLSNVSSINAWADSDIATLKVSVVGGGTVVLDDYESKYTLGSGDVFKANCTVDTELKISLKANEGNIIDEVSINGEVAEEIPRGSKSASFGYALPVEGGDIRVTFSSSVAPPVAGGEASSDTPKPEEVGGTVAGSEAGDVVDSGEVSDKAETEGSKEEEVPVEDAKEEVVAEDNIVARIISEYRRGIYDSEEAVAFRKKLVEEHNLEKYVTEDNFFKSKYALELSIKSDLKEFTALVPVSRVGLIDELLPTNEAGEDLLGFIKYNSITNGFLKLLAFNLPKSMVLENTGNMSYVFNGYTTWGDSYLIDGKVAFCAEHNVSSPPDNTPILSTSVITNSDARKVLYYGYGGPGEKKGLDRNGYYIATAVGLSAALGTLGNSSGNIGRHMLAEVQKLPEPPSSFTAYLAHTPSGLQNLGFWVNNPVGSLQINKVSADPSITNGNNCYDLTGAEYGVYTGASGTGLVGTLTIGSNGWSNELSLDAGTYYIKEIKAPKGYALDTKTHSVTVTSGNKATLTVSDIPQSDPVGLLLKKVDADTGRPVPVGQGSLKDAQFTVKFYAGEYQDGINPADLGVSPSRTWVLKTDEDGFTYLDTPYKVSGDPFYTVQGNPDPTLPLGTVTIEETLAPVGYKINPEVFVRKITSTGSVPNVNTYNVPIIKEESLSFSLKKVQTGTDITLPNVKFRHTNPDGTTEDLTTNSNGEIEIRGLAQGVHKIVETKALDGYVINTNEFVFEVTTANTIVVKTNTTNLGMTYTEVNGNGHLVVENDLGKFSLKLIKVNDKNSFLEGAEFTLYSDKDCRNEIAKKVTDKQGVINFGDLTPGTKYYFKETKAPAGYSIPVDSVGRVHVYEVYIESAPASGVFNFFVDGVKYGTGSTSGDIFLSGTPADRVVNIKIVNNIGMKLPKTGSGVMIPLMLTGIGIMGTSLRRSNRCKEDE